MNRPVLAGILILWGIFAWGSVPEGTAQPSFSLKLKDHATVQGKTILLEDIAEVQGEPRSLAEKIGHLKIQMSPLPGQVAVISRRFLLSQMERSEYSSYFADSQIPDEITVTRQGWILEKGEAARMLEDHLQKILGDERKTVQVKDIQGYGRVVVPPGSVTWEWRTPDRISSGNAPVSLTLMAEGKNIQEVRFNARLEIHSEVVVSKNYLPRLHVLETRDVQLAKKNVALLPPDVVTDLSEVLGKRMTLSLNQQEVLRKSMLEVPPLVKKGDRVTLLAEKEFFRITAVGEVKEDGREGEQVRVMNVSSRKEVHGRVLDSQTVQIDF